MGGDDSQKLLPWRGSYSSPGPNLRLTANLYFTKTLCPARSGRWLLRTGEVDSTFPENNTSYLVNRGPRA